MVAKLLSVSVFLSLAATTIAVPYEAFDSSNIFPRAACNANNCLRAVTGTRPGQTQTRADRLGDCSSFLRQTVTPDPVTVFVTTTPVVPPAPPKREVLEQEVAKRAVTVIPTDVPAYASPCSGTVKYSSACSCYGATATTVTIPVPAVTVTVSCDVMATFYTGTWRSGESFSACGARGECINVPASFAKQASSLAWGSANSCVLYTDPGCTNGVIGLNADTPVTGINDFRQLQYDFDNKMSSFICRGF